VPCVNAIKSYVDASISNGVSVTTGSFTLDAARTGATVDACNIRQIGSVVYVDMVMDLGTAIGTGSLNLGTISGVASPVNVSAILPCATSRPNSGFHVGAAVISSGWLSLYASDADDKYVYINVCYQAATT